MTVVAACSKNRRQAVLPIRQDLAAELERWSRERGDERDARVWAIPPTGKSGYRTAAMLKRDLQAAGIAYQDEDGKFADFHSLRCTYVTWLLQKGASEHHVRKLARHSTLDLTVNTYSKVDVVVHTRRFSEPRLCGGQHGAGCGEGAGWWWVDRGACGTRRTRNSLVRAKKRAQAELTPPRGPVRAPLASNGGW